MVSETLKLNLNTIPYYNKLGHELSLDIKESALQHSFLRSRPLPCYF